MLSLRNLINIFWVIIGVAEIENVKKRAYSSISRRTKMKKNYQHLIEEDLS